MTFYASLIMAMLLTLVLIPPLIRYAFLIGAVDKPDPRKVHVNVVPRIGGIAMIFGALVPLVIWLPYEKQYVAIALGTLVIVAFGIWDDRKDISYRYKFLGQILASALVVLGGDIYIMYAPFMDGQPLPLMVSYAFSIFCLLAITNALNLADGLDGLAGGTTLLSFGLIAILSYKAGASGILIVTMSVVGGVIGFLRFNSHPASIFMGDTGSQFLGFILGVELIMLTQFADLALSKSIPLLILGLPLVDTLTVMSKRIMRGVSPFSADKNHIHHRLLALKFSHYETVVILYLIQSVFVISAFLTCYSEDWLPTTLFVVYTLLLTTILSAMESEKLNFYYNGWIRKWSKARVLGWRRSLRAINLDRYLPYYVLGLVPLMILFAGADDIHVSLDVAVLSVLLAALLVFGIRRAHQNEWLDRLGAYTFCALLCYLGYKNQNHDGTFYIVEWLLIVVAGLWVFMTISVQRKSRRFETSPFDILLILLALLIPLFADSASAVDHLPLDVFKFVVLLYLFEYIINSGIYYRFRLLPYSLTAGALFIAGKGLLFA
ncbi:MAG: MraY family glycosyltransferase [Pseudomonadota bacterium]|nr:MraY family glycosyltransferase [Pseudomonadota bacterium]